MIIFNSDRTLSSSGDVCPFETVLVLLPKLGVDTAVQADLVNRHGGAEKDKVGMGGPDATYFFVRV